MKSKQYLFTEQEVLHIREALDHYKHTVRKPMLAEQIKKPERDEDLISRITKGNLQVDALLQQFKQDYSRM